MESEPNLPSTPTIPNEQPKFEKINFNTVRSGKFITKAGNYMTLAKLILNGKICNFGTVDGAVTMKDYSTWIFIAPANRWDMTYFKNLPLRETLNIIAEDAKNAPIKAFDEFVAYLAMPEIEYYCNLFLFSGVSSCKIGTTSTDLPCIISGQDFSEFAGYVRDHVGLCGNILTGNYIYDKDLVIPISMYMGQPISFKLKNPIVQPTAPSTALGYGEISKGQSIIQFNNCNGLYGKNVFWADVPDQGRILYSFEATLDNNGIGVPEGWSVFDGEQYASFDIEKEPIEIPYEEGMYFTYIMRVFSDISFETQEGYRYKLNNAIDLTQIPESFIAEGEGTEVWMILKEKSDDNNDMLAIYKGTPASFNMYVYTERDSIIDGNNISAGWTLVHLNAATGELEGFSPYDIEKNPLYIDFGSNNINVSHPDINISILGEYAGISQIPLEEYYATINFIFRA